MNILKPFRMCSALLALALSTLFAPPAATADVVPLIQTKSDTYKNVTLVSRTDTHVCVQHSRGMATLKLVDLNNETLYGLGILSEQELVAANAPQNATGNAAAMAAIGSVMDSLPESVKSQIPTGTTLPPIDQKILLIALGVVAFIHLFFSYCAMLICKKAGTEPGLLVWIPILQLYPMVRAAGMSGWWFLAWLLPVVNVVAAIMWCVKIAQVRGKGVLTTIMLILPVTNLFAFLYLAFSGGSAPDEEEEDGRPIRLSPLPA